MMSFTNVYLQKGEETVISYRSGLTVYEEVFAHGMLYAAGWNTAGYPLNVLTGYPSRLKREEFFRPAAFQLTVNGESVEDALYLKEVETIEEGDRKRVKVHLESQRFPLLVTVCTLLDGTGIFSRYLEIENRGEASLAITALSLMSGGVESITPPYPVGSAAMTRKADDIYRIGYMTDERACSEGDFAFRPLPPETTVIQGKCGIARHRFPMAILENRVSGTIFTMQMAYSGGFAFSFHLEAHDTMQKSALSFAASVVDPVAPLYRIEGGETLVTPSLEVGMLRGDLDQATTAMHDHLRQMLCPLDNTPFCLVGAGMGPEHDMSVETTCAFMDQMAEAGAEVFIVDAGWNCPPNKEGEWSKRAGDWYADPDRYPNGIRQISDYAHKLGMKFGMWMEPERFGNLSKAFEEHPDWRVTLPNGEKGNLVDMTNPDAASWAENQVARVIETYRLDLFRVDYNIKIRELFTKSAGKDKEGSSLRHTLAVYRMYENLRRRFPKVIFENCASGGARCDAGIMRYFHHTWVSDNQVPPYSAAITNGMLLTMPPERMDRLVAGMGCHKYGSLDFHLRNAMLGHMTLNVLSPRTADWNEEQLAFVRHSVEIYKHFIRPYLATAKVLRHTEENASFHAGGCIITELAAEDKSRSAITLLTGGDAVAKEYTVYPRGISFGDRYRVTLDNDRETAILDGAVLKNNGIRVRIPYGIGSELILLEKVDEKA